jgi:prepilin-type N-terminal cleavage/methylation domain-containing protein
MKKGFTLLELIIVIIIVSILAALGFVQFFKVIERSRGVEAKSILGNLRQAQIGYYQENGIYAASVDDLSTEAPTSCISTHYFSYTVGSDFGTAVRCTANGKPPDLDAPPYAINLNWTGGAWGGSAGYF